MKAPGANLVPTSCQSTWFASVQRAEAAARMPLRFGSCHSRSQRCCGRSLLQADPEKTYTASPVVPYPIIDLSFASSFPRQSRHAVHISTVALGDHTRGQWVSSYEPL